MAPITITFKFDATIGGDVLRNQGSELLTALHAALKVAMDETLQKHALHQIILEQPAITMLDWRPT